MRENGIVRFRKFIGDRARQFNQPFAVARELVAALDFLFFASVEIRRGNFVDLMSKQIEFLFACRFHSVERRVVGEQRLQLPVLLSVFAELLLGACEGIEQAQLLVGREQRLVIVRAMKIDQFIAKIF